MSKNLCEHPEINLCCKKCGTKLKYKDSYKGYQYGGFVDGYVETNCRVECPFCHQIYELEVCFNLPELEKKNIRHFRKWVDEDYDSDY